MRADTGIKNVMLAKNDDVIVVDETASDEGDSYAEMSSKCNDTDRKEEQELTITEDVVQNSSSSPSMVRHDGSSGHSSTFKQSVIEQERNVAEEMQGSASFVRSLVEENEDLKRRMGQLCIENEELVTECKMMSKGITYEENEVLVLEDRIRELEEHFEALQGEFGELDDQDRVTVGHFSQANCKATPAFSDRGSCRRSLSLKNKDILTQSLVEEQAAAIDDEANEEEEEGRQRVESIACRDRIDVIIEEEEDDDYDEEYSLLDDDTLTDITLDNTLTEEEFSMQLIALASDPTTQNTGTPRKSNSDESGSSSEKEVNCYGNRRLSEDVIAKGVGVCIVKSDGDWTENSFGMEESDATKNKGEKREDGNEQQEREKRGVECTDKEPVKKESRECVSINYSGELKKYSVDEQEARGAENEKDAEAIESNIRGIRGGTQEKKKHMRDGTPQKGGEITEEGQNNTQDSYRLTKFIEQVWSIIGGSRQIEDVVSVNGNNVCCDDDQLAKVAHVIWELKEENSELYLQQYELKEVVQFLNDEVKLTKEEVNDLKTSKDQLERERDELANMCRELNEKCRRMQDENFNISTTCQLLQEEHQLAECLVKDLEQKCVQKEKMYLRMEDQCRSLQLEKSNVALTQEGTADLEKKVTFWSQICGKLYSFLKKDNAEMAKVEERCAKISKLAKTERSHRKRVERKNKKLLRRDKIRSEILGSRAKLSRRMGEKMLDLQIEIERLQSEIIKVKADRNGFEDSYKSAVVFSTELRHEVARLESRNKLFEQILDRRTSELNKVLIDKKLTSEELTRVRKVKREHKKKVEELIEERRAIAMEVQQAKEEEIVEAKEKIKEKEILLNLCRLELERITDKLKAEAENRRLLELSVKEEKMMREDVEQRLRGTVQRLNEAEERLEEAITANEELENAIEAQQQEPVKSEKKRGFFGRWFRRRKRKSH